MTTRWIDRRLHIRERKCEKCGQVWDEIRLMPDLMVEQMGLVASAVNAKKPHQPLESAGKEGKR